MRERLFIATVSENAEALARQYHMGIELDQFCMAENMDLPEFDGVDAEIKRLTDSFPKGRMILHGPFNELFPAAIDPKARRLAVDRYQQAYRLAQTYGINKMVLHSGYVPFVYFKEWHHSQSVRFWKDFMGDKPPDFTLCIENVLEDEPEMLLKIMQEIEDDRIKICLDTGHAHRMSEFPVAGWIETLGPYIDHIHLHNNFRDYDVHNPIFEGTMEISQVLQAVQTHCPDHATITLECLTSRSSLEWLEKEGYLK